MSKTDIKYCALGDEGIEASFKTQAECQDFIDEQIKENEMDEDYYQIVTYTKAELDAMPEG